MKKAFKDAGLFLLILMLAFAAWAQSQEQTNPTLQAGAKPAKEQLKPEEPEAKSSASTEALQKATQNPVASLISVPIQNNNNFWYESRLSNIGRFEHSARDTDRHFEGLEPPRPINYADCLATIAQPTGKSRNGAYGLPHSLMATLSIP